MHNKQPPIEIADTFLNKSAKIDPAADGEYRDDIFIIEKTRLTGCRQYHDYLRIPKGVRTICKNAFKNHTHIRRVILPDSLKTIEEDAFFNCTQLEEIVFPQGLKTIKKGAFHHCRSLKALRFPKSLQKLDDDAFAWCHEITEVVFEEGCSLELEYPPFHYFPKLRLITIPASVKIRNPDALGYDPGTVMQCYAGSDAYFVAKYRNLRYILSDGREYDATGDFVIANGVLTGYLGKNPEVIIPEGTRSIGVDAFRNCEIICRVVIPDSVTHIDDGAFSGCTNLTSIRLPLHLKRIPKDAFYKCRYLKEINFPQNITAIESNAFFGTGLRTVRLPQGLESIHDQAFGSCMWLCEIHIPASVRLLENVSSGSRLAVIVAPENSTAAEYARANAVPLRHGSITPPAPPRSEDLPGNIRRIYYEALRPVDQLVYSILVPALLRMDDSCCFESISLENASEYVVKEALVYDYPELFWVDHGKLQFCMLDPGQLDTAYAVTKQQRDQMQKQIDALVNPFLASIPRNLSDYEKAKRAYSWVADKLEYDHIGLEKQSKQRYSSVTKDDLRNIYGAFVKKKVVCEGYARALQYLLQRMGIACIECTGGEKTQDAHAWVCARLDGDFYHLDITLDDNYLLEYKYFCLTDDEMYKHQHHFSFPVNKMQCNATGCSYYAKEGLYWEHVDEDEILERIRQYLSCHPCDRLSVKFANLLLLQQAYTCLKSNQKLRNLLHGLSNLPPVVIPDETNLLLEIRF